MTGFFLKKTYVIAIIFLLIGFQNIPNIRGESYENEIISDETDDVVRWYQINDEWNWEYVDDKPDCDITEISYETDESDSTLSLSLEVNGIINESVPIIYRIYYEAVNASYEMFYSNGSGYINGLDKNSGIENTAEVNIVDNLLTGTIGLMGNNNSKKYFYGYTHNLTKTDDYFSEWWSDYAYEDDFTPDIAFIDDDYKEDTPEWEITRFNNIQQGIDIVFQSGEIFVYNGIYYENIIINKSISLLGNPSYYQRCQIALT